MLALIIGAVMICFTVFAALPPESVGFGLGWGKDILLFLQRLSGLLRCLSGSPISKINRMRKKKKPQ